MNTTEHFSLLSGEAREHLNRRTDMIVNIRERQLQGVIFERHNGQAYIGWMPSGEYTFMYKCDMDIHTATERKGVKLSYTYPKKNGEQGYTEYWYIGIPAWDLLVAEQKDSDINMYMKTMSDIVGSMRTVN